MIPGTTGPRNGHLLAFSPDDKTLAFTEGKTVTLWDLASGKARVTMNANWEVSALAYSPDGKLVATGSQFMHLQFWDPETGEQKALLHGPDGFQNWWSCAQFSADSKTLAIGGSSGILQLWDVASRESRASLKGHTDGIWAVAFSPDGRTLISGGDDETVRLWDVLSGQERATLPVDQGRIRSVCLSPDGKTLATLGAIGPVKLWHARADAEADCAPNGTGGR